MLENTDRKLLWLCPPGRGCCAPASAPAAPGRRDRSAEGGSQPAYSRLRGRPWPLTVKMPSSVVAVMPSRWAMAISFFMASVTVWPHTTSTRDRRSRSRAMSSPSLCSWGTGSFRNRGRNSAGQMGA